MKQDDESLYGGPLDMPGAPLTMPPPRRQSPHGSGKKIVLIVAILLVLALISFGGWRLLGKKNQSTNPPSAAETPVDTPPSSANVSDVQDTTETKTYKGDRPRIQFTYPVNWAVSEKGDGGVRIESPEFEYQTVDGTQTTGVFRIYIRQGARANDSTTIGRGVAIAPSEKITYTEPAPGQRSETNLSFFGLDNPDHFAYFFIAGNFVLQKGDTLGPSYGKEPETYIIAGGYSSKELTEDLATNKIPLDFYQQTKVYQQAMTILKSIKLL